MPVPGPQAPFEIRICFLSPPSYLFSRRKYRTLTNRLVSTHNLYKDHQSKNNIGSTSHRNIYSCFRKPCPINFFQNLFSNRREQACDLLRQFGTTGKTSRLSQIGALSLHPLEFSCITVFLHQKKFTGLIYGIIKPAEELKGHLLRTG